MDIILIFFLELFFLFLLSRFVQRYLSQFIFTLTRSIKWTVVILSIVFLPGTLLHEIAHFLFASLLFVPVGKMELIPRLDGDTVKLGSVAIGKTNRLKRLLIGIAPFLVGTAIILFTLYLTEQNMLWKNTWAIVAIFYILFEVGNSMFSSKKDLEGASVFVAIIAVLTILFYALGLRITVQDINSLLNDQTIHLFYQGVIYLMLPIGLDIILILLLGLSVKILGKSQ